MKKVALYLRLSKEDFNKDLTIDISQSIKNQEIMLKEEVNKHKDWLIFNIYCDEDFSGAGTYRPAFEKMIEDCKNGKIDIVLCKSQSRFSRDMEIIETYLHNKFIEWNIRFISLIDNADTQNLGNKKARQINALVNEWFLEDLSNNIKATFQSKWKNGECTSAFAKYGLLKDPKNKNHLIIDPIASEVLKNIAHMFLKGYGQDKIAKELEKNNIPSPYEYKLMNGCKLQIPLLNKEKNKTIVNPGTYIIHINLYNKYNCILKNITSIFALKSNSKKDYNQIKQIKIRSIANDLKLYYTTIKNINFTNIDLENNNIWHLLKTDEDILDNVTYIASFNHKLDRLIETGFELEVTLPQNKNLPEYQLFTKSKAQNTNIPFSFNYTIRKKYKWSGRVIYKMLKDEIYNGTLVQGKTKRISYKNHTSIHVPSNNWIRIPNAVEKIFDDETWYKIQQKMKEKNKASSNGIKHLFSGKIYCNNCGNIFHKNSSQKNKNSDKIDYLICSEKKNNWLHCNNKKSIKIKDLEENIIKQFNNILKKDYDYKLFKKLLKQNINEDIFKQQLEVINLEQQQIQTNIQKKKNIFPKLYEDKLIGIITNDEFQSLKKQYTNDIDKLNQRLNSINNKLKTIKNQKKQLYKKFICSKFLEINQLDTLLINEMIDKIYIDNLNNNKRTIKIVWNF